MTMAGRGLPFRIRSSSLTLRKSNDYNESPREAVYCKVSIHGACRQTLWRTSCGSWKATWQSPNGLTSTSRN